MEHKTHEIIRNTYNMSEDRHINGDNIKMNISYRERMDFIHLS